MTKRLGIFVTHPIQYFAPLWRNLATTPGIELIVHFFSDHSVRGGLDQGFGIAVAWDVPVLEGYEHRFIRRDADLSRPGSIALPQARQIMQDGRFDAVLVHGYQYRFERQVVGAARSLGIRTILRGELTDAPSIGDDGTARRSWKKRLLRRPALIWFYRKIDRFCCIGSAARAHLLGHGVPEGRMFFSPYSVDTTLLESQRRRFDRQETRQSLGLAEDSVVLLFSGKLIPRKQPLLLLEAITRIKDTSRLRLIVLGDGELRQQVENRGRQILGDRLLMAGFVNQSQLGRYYQASDVFICPSMFETWGLVVNEAMQFGLPVVASAGVGSTADLVIEGRTGFTFPVDDAQALAGHLERLIADPRLRQEMGVAAREQVSGYSVENSAAGIVRAVES